MVTISSSQKISIGKNPIVRFVVAGIVATVAFDLVMYADIAITGIPSNIPNLLGSLLLGESQYAEPLGHIIHLGNGIGLSLIFGFVALPIARKISKIPIIVTAITFSIIELIVAVWYVMLPSLGMGIAGIDVAPEMMYVTLARHVAFGAVLGLYLSQKGVVE